MSDTAQVDVSVHSEPLLTALSRLTELAKGFPELVDRLIDLTHLSPELLGTVVRDECVFR